MKKRGILHPDLCHVLTSMGHTDYLTICDKGFPVPAGPRRIDLALVEGIPTILDVLEAIAAEWSIDRLLITTEMTEVSPRRVDEIRSITGSVPFEVVSHLELKRLAQTANATVKTGDPVPYANMIVVSG